MTTTNVDYADGRRAASYLAFVITKDSDGIYAVIDEATDADRLPELLRTIAAFLVNAAPEMRNAALLAEMRERIVKYTAAEQQEAEDQR